MIWLLPVPVKNKQAENKAVAISNVSCRKKEISASVKNFICQISYGALLDLHRNCGALASLPCCGKDVDMILNKAYHL